MNFRLLPGPPRYCHEDSGFPEIDFHVTRFQIMVPLPISIPRGNKNLTGHRIEGPNVKIGDYACWQCSRQVISHIKYPCTWQQLISNFPFPFSFFLYYKSREGGQLVLMWLFARCTFYLMNIFIFLKATMRNHLMPPPQALKFLQIFYSYLWSRIFSFRLYLDLDLRSYLWFKPPEVIPVHLVSTSNISSGSNGEAEVLSQKSTFCDFSTTKSPKHQTFNLVFLSLVQR